MASWVAWPNYGSGAISICLGLFLAVLALSPQPDTSIAQLEENSNTAPTPLLPKLTTPAALHLPSPPVPAFSSKLDGRGEVSPEQSTMTKAPEIVPLKPETESVGKNNQRSDFKILHPMPLAVQGDLPEKIPGDQRSGPHSTPAASSLTRLEQGRVLLKILEHGKGPAIEIRWPETLAERMVLYRYFTHCLGMRMALMDGQGNLFVPEGRPGNPWTLDLDQYSGYVRQTNGAMTPAESWEIKRILDHHRGIAKAIPVRLFPRRIDAMLLGGLASLLGKPYGMAKNIRAAYSMAAGVIYVGGVTLDGRTTVGRVGLSPQKLECRI